MFHLYHYHYLCKPLFLCQYREILFPIVLGHVFHALGIVSITCGATDFYLSDMEIQLRYLGVLFVHQIQISLNASSQ